MGEVSAKSLMYKLSDSFKDMSNDLEIMKGNQADMKDELRDIRERINDPDIGIIVATNKNTDYRREAQQLAREDSKREENQTRKIDELTKWKAIIDRAMWTVFSIIAGIIAKLIFFN